MKLFRIDLFKKPEPLIWFTPTAGFEIGQIVYHKISGDCVVIVSFSRDEDGLMAYVTHSFIESGDTWCYLAEVTLTAPVAAERTTS